MADTPDVRPVGGLPNEIGKTAARELALNGITSLEQVAGHQSRPLRVTAICWCRTVMRWRRLGSAPQVLGLLAC